MTTGRINQITDPTARSENRESPGRSRAKRRPFQASRSFCPKTNCSTALGPSDNRLISYSAKITTFTVESGYRTESEDQQDVIRLRARIAGPQKCHWHQAARLAVCRTAKTCQPGEEERRADELSFSRTGKNTLVRFSLFFLFPPHSSEPPFSDGTRKSYTHRAQHRRRRELAGSPSHCGTGHSFSHQMVHPARRIREEWIFLPI